ncbi:MAG: hypothetical protein WBV94_20025 [Blastocatellia bacterium]
MAPFYFGGFPVNLSVMIGPSVKSWLILVAVIFTFIACESSITPRTPDNNQSTAQSIPNETRLWLLKQARARLGGKAIEQQSATQEAKASRRAMLFVTRFVRGQSSQPLMGVGDSLVAALKVALESVVKENRPPPDRIQIDILDGNLAPLVKPVESEPDDLSKLSATELIAVGAEGIAIESENRSLYVLPSELIYKSIVAGNADEQKASDLLNRAAVYLGLDQQSWRAAGVKLSRFRTISFVEDHAHQKALSLVNACVPVTEISRQQLLKAARAGGDYLIRAQKPDGGFYYSYNPLEGRASERAYNILRHAGAAISLFDLYAATGDARYANSARRALGYLKTRYRAAREAGSVYVIDNDGKAKLGANGLALVALTKQMELDPKSSDRESAAQLAALILQMQRKDGSFESYYGIRGDEPGGSVSLYYPGEAILGLIQLYRHNGDKRLLEAARRGAVYLIESQSRMRNLPPDAWLIQAIEALHSIEREPRYGVHSMALAESMINDQYEESEREGFAGGFRPGLPRATPAASRAEGMLAAYRIARLINDTHASRIAGALKLSARFQLSQQFDRDNSFFLIDAERAAGGFREGLASMRIRIDFVQHNISSLLGIAAILN